MEPIEPPEELASMDSLNVSRRKMLLGTGASIAALDAAKAALPALAQENAKRIPATPGQVRRMEWGHAAKFGCSSTSASTPSINPAKRNG